MSVENGIQRWIFALRGSRMTTEALRCNKMKTGDAGDWNNKEMKTFW